MWRECQPGHEKREVQNAVITGIQLDMLGEQRKLMEPLQTLIETDESLYGVDEILSFSIVNLYGSIGYTTMDISINQTGSARTFKR